MGIGTIILLGLIAGEVIALVKIGKQKKRIEELEDKAGIKREKK